jgi:ketosteroid isomerase-like protein
MTLFESGVYVMTKLVSVVMIFFALVLSVPPQIDDSTSDTVSLVEAERAFARASVDKGTRAAFLENLAADSIVFQPGPVNGQKWWTARPVRPGVLSWEPIFAYVARSNDLGYTTGPWEFRPKSLEDTPVAYGNFVSIWKRQKDGVWKVALDIGTDNPPLHGSSEEVKLGVGHPRKGKAKATAGPKVGIAHLFKANDEFIKLFSSKPPIDSLRSYLADDVRLFRMNEQPVIGKQAVLDALVSRPGTLTRVISTGALSRERDLGYTYGSYDFNSSEGSSPKESGHYIRIWRMRPSGQWEVVVDLMRPTPPPVEPSPSQ